MSWVTILPDSGNPSIVSFDTTISETHDQTATVTEHPIEDGSLVSDHVIRDPFVFSCEVYISNTPSEDKGAGSIDTVEIPSRTNSPPLKIQALHFDEERDFVQETTEALQALVGQSCAVLTSVKTYDRMVLVAASVPRAEYGGASFQLGFKQIRTVETRTVKAPQPVEPRGGSSQNKGGQSAKKTKGKDQEQASFTIKALQAVGLVK